jgi:hypothetical protein
MGRVHALAGHRLDRFQGFQVRDRAGPCSASRRWHEALDTDEHPRRGTNTVNAHIRSIYAKLQVRDRSSAVRRARELRLLAAVGRMR